METFLVFSTTNKELLLPIIKVLNAQTNALLRRIPAPYINLPTRNGPFIYAKTFWPSSYAKALE